MPSSSQRSALRNYRERLAKRGLARFEVLGLDSDRDLLRSLARRLAQNDAEAVRLRADVRRSVDPGEPRRGGILAALRRSPLVGAEIEFVREPEFGRPVDL
jgi:hypothetical protein